MRERLARAEMFLLYLDGNWKQLEAAATPFDWPRIAECVRVEIARIRSAVVSLLTPDSVGER